MVFICEGMTNEYSAWWNREGTIKVVLYHRVWDVDPYYGMELTWEEINERIQD